MILRATESENLDRHADIRQRLELLRLAGDPNPVVRVAALGWLQLFRRLDEATKRGAA